MKEKLKSYILQIPGLESQSSAKLVDYFVYFLIVVEKQECVKAQEVQECFGFTNLTKYSNIPSYLSKNSKRKRGSKPRFIKAKQGYTLERNAQLEIQKTLKVNPAKKEEKKGTVRRGTNSGPLLYKYRGLNALHFLIDIIRTNKLYAALFTELNDPMEGVYSTSDRITDAMKRRIYEKKTQLRICALSKKKNSTLMWSHYADSHQGVVLGVRPVLNGDIEEINVTYTTSLQTWGENGDSTRIAREVFSKKLIHWKYEKEVRLLTPSKFVPIEIEEVFIGCKAKAVDVERIRFLFDGTIDTDKITQLSRDELDVNSEDDF